MLFSFVVKADQCGQLWNFSRERELISEVNTQHSPLTVESAEGPDYAGPAANRHVHRPGGEDAGGDGRHDPVRGVGHRVEGAADEARGTLPAVRYRTARNSKARMNE